MLIWIDLAKTLVRQRPDADDQSVASVTCQTCMTTLNPKEVLTLSSAEQGVSGILWRLYVGQEVRCVNHEKHGGLCAWTGLLEDYQAHLRNCVLCCDAEPQPYIAALRIGPYV